MNRNIQQAIATLLIALVALPAFAQSVTSSNLSSANHVSLVLQFDSATECNSGRAFFERFPDGSLATEEFIVPNGANLVMTDFRWSAIPTPASFATNAILEATLLIRFGSESFRLMYTSMGVNLTPDFSSMNRVAGSDVIAAGIRVDSGRFLCATAQSKTVNFTAFHTVANAEINGYLVKNLSSAGLTKD